MLRVTLGVTRMDKRKSQRRVIDKVKEYKKRVGVIEEQGIM